MAPVFMHFWNQENFSGLRAIGERFAAREGWQAFGNYCLLKEQGLKKQALAEVQKFVAQARSLPTADQRILADELAGLAYANPEVRQLLAHPLQVYLQQVFSAWAEVEFEDPRPHRWLGYLMFNRTLDRSFYLQALAIDPHDQISLEALARADLNCVEFQCHHLSESCLLGNLVDARQSLRDAESLIARLNDEVPAQRLRERSEYFRCLLDGWEMYSQLNSALSFPQWCSTQGYDFQLGTVFYFKK